MMIRLNVITVPTFDWDGTRHIAYTVFEDTDGVLRTSSGWTLRDALDFFADAFGLRKDMLKVQRPFVPQEIHLRNAVEYM